MLSRGPRDRRCPALGPGSSGEASGVVSSNRATSATARVQTRPRRPPDRLRRRRRPPVRLVCASIAATIAALALAAPAGAAPAAVGSWAKVARTLTIPVLKPTKTFGMRLGFVNVIGFDPGCANDGREQLRAFYGQEAGRFLEVFEGRPRYCLDRPIDAPIVRQPKIHGTKARLHRINKRRLALEWCERGTTIALVSEGVRAAKLIAVGRSVRPVDKARALPCDSS